MVFSMVLSINSNKSLKIKYKNGSFTKEWGVNRFLFGRDDSGHCERSARRLLLGLLPLLLAACAVVAPVAEDAVLSNTVRWSTASESDNFGFDVYRSEHADGPFERITVQPVNGAGTTDLVQRYWFEDRGIKPGTVYFYYVESISLDGRRKRLTPVMKAQAKD